MNAVLLKLAHVDEHKFDYVRMSKYSTHSYYPYVSLNRFANSKNVRMVQRVPDDVDMGRVAFIAKL